MEHFPAFPDFILALIFGVLVPFISGIRSATLFQEIQAPFDTVSKRKFYVGNSIFLLLMAFIVLLVWFIYRRPLSDLGFRLPDATPWHLHWWLTGIFIVLFLSDSFLSLREARSNPELQQEQQQQTPFMPTQVRDLPAYFLMCLAAGIGEEIVYRGFLVTFFFYLFNGSWAQSTLAILVPAAIFSIAHFYQGVHTVFKILVLSTLFGMIFLNTHSLLTVVLLHTGVDLVSGILSIYLSSKQNV